MTCMDAYSIQAALFERLRELKVEGSLELITESDVEGMSFPGWKEEPHSPASLTLKGQRKIRDDGDKSRASSLPSKLLCRVVVAADGGNSLIRLKRGLITSGLGYGQRALVATLRTDSKVNRSPHPPHTNHFLNNDLPPPRTHPI